MKFRERVENIRVLHGCLVRLKRAIEIQKLVCSKTMGTQVRSTWLVKNVSEQCQQIGRKGFGFRSLNSKCFIVWPVLVRTHGLGSVVNFDVIRSRIGNFAKRQENSKQNTQ